MIRIHSDEDDVGYPDLAGDDDSSLSEPDALERVVHA